MSSAAAMPVEESGNAHRRYARYQLSVPFDLTVFRPGTVMCLSGQAQDVGEGGLCGALSGAVLAGERVELSILLPVSPEPLNLRAVVRHHADLLCGFEFLSLEHGQRELLQKLGSDPGLRSCLINETEWEAGMEPPPRSQGAVCSECGQELAEEIPVCLACGTPQAQEPPQPLEEEGGEHEAAAPAETGEAKGLPARKEAPTRRRGPALDSVVAIIFLVTLSIGLWQWLYSPADADSQAEPSPVTVELENVFLRSTPSASQESATELSTPNAALAAAKSAVSAFIGDVSLPSAQPASDTSSRSAGASVQRTETAVSNSPRNSSAAPALPTQTAPAPPATPADGAAENAASNLTEQSSGATNTASALAGKVPRSSELAGMLLQKVLPVYPEQARRQGVQGQVVLKAVIGKDGTIAELRPLQGPEELTAAAIDAVQHWRFRPYELKGKPVEVETDIRLNFQLPSKK